MLNLIFGIETSGALIGAGSVLAFLLTLILISALKNRLPIDGGREHAADGQVSKGKRKGAGVIFVLVYAFVMLLLLPADPEYLIYIAAIILGMLSGFLDDAASKPWGRMKKGLCDLVISVGVSLTYVLFNGSTFSLAICNCSITLPEWLFVILGAGIIFVAINVTNCTDGVDALSSSVGVVAFIAFTAAGMVIGNPFAGGTNVGTMALPFVGCLFAYLIFNADPCIVMMGDAGSRTMGLLLALLALRSGTPLLYIPLCLIFIIDGGTGLIKVALIKCFKLYIFKNIHFPLHDHLRKQAKWSKTQVAYRLAITGAVISTAYISLIALIR